MSEEIKTTVRIEKEIHKKIRRFCIDHEISLQEFAMNSMIYCMEKNIIPKKDK